MMMNFDYASVLSDEEETAIRERQNNGERLFRRTFDFDNGVHSQVDVLYSPDELAAFAAEQEAAAPKGD